MTIFTKPNVFIQIKSDTSKCPAAEETIIVETVGERVETYPLKPQGCRPNRFSLCLLLILLMAGIYTGLYLCRRALKPMQRYQGFCSIPIDTKQLQESQLIEPNYRMLPLRWSSDPDVQVFSDEPGPDDLVNFLREELDIAGTVEKITVYDNGRQTSFIHDFGSNITGIVDADRCFTMELDPQLVLAPDAFVFSIQEGGHFDVTRVRSSLRALLPPLPALPARALPDHCHDKPVYRLQPDDAPIRKRSAKLRPDFMQFAGRHIHEIDIKNLGEIISHERK